MGKTVRELLREIDSRELSEWIAYSKFEPFGELRQDRRIGTLATIVASMFGGKGSRKFSPETFFPELGYLRGIPKQQSSTTLKDQLVALTKALGGKFVKRGEKAEDKPKKARRKK